MRRPGARGVSPWPMLAGLVLVLPGGAPSARAAEFSLKPSLALTEEYNDNILDVTSPKRSDFVTRVLPSAALLYKSAALTGDALYSFEYRNYARGTRDDETLHSLSLRGKAELLENFCFLELNDTLSRVSLSLTRDATSDSLFLNQTDQNVASVSPYLLWRLGEKSSLRTGYRFTDTRYWGSAAIDKLEHRGFAQLNREISRYLSLSLDSSYSRVSTDRVDYQAHDLSAGFRYEFRENSSVTGAVGNSWQNFSDSRKASNLFWNVGLTNDFGFVTAILETRVQFTEDPLSSSTKETSYGARLEKALEHGSVGVSASYAEYVRTQVAGQDQYKTAVTAFGRLDLSSKLSATASAVADQVTGHLADDFKYHLNGSAGLSYAFNYDIAAALTYTYVDFRRELDSASGSKQTNRVSLEVRKVF